mmetsp:Transcript_108073/g.301360  ORF Transcript_108073/g.301360 Transcript_108073/m.301360 type:complete len:223 (+) Transcript_108073:275-943(+)
MPAAAGLSASLPRRPFRTSRETLRARAPPGRDGSTLLTLGLRPGCLACALLKLGLRPGSRDCLTSVLLMLGLRPGSRDCLASALLTLGLRPGSRACRASGLPTLGLRPGSRACLGCALLMLGLRAGSRDGLRPCCRAPGTELRSALACEWSAAGNSAIATGSSREASAGCSSVLSGGSGGSSRNVHCALGTAPPPGSLWPGRSGGTKHGWPLELRPVSGCPL